MSLLMTLLIFVLTVTLTGVFSDYEAVNATHPLLCNLNFLSINIVQRIINLLWK